MLPVFICLTRLAFTGLLALPRSDLASECFGHLLSLTLPPCPCSHKRYWLCCNGTFPCFSGVPVLPKRRETSGSCPALYGGEPASRWSLPSSLEDVRSRLPMFRMSARRRTRPTGNTRRRSSSTAALRKTGTRRRCTALPTCCARVHFPPPMGVPFSLLVATRQQQAIGMNRRLARTEPRRSKGLPTRKFTSANSATRGSVFCATRQSHSTGGNGLHQPGIRRRSTGLP